MASAIGFYTRKGQLLRASLFPAPYSFKFYSEPLKIVGILVLILITAFIIIAPPLIANLELYDFIMVFLDLLSFIV